MTKVDKLKAKYDQLVKDTLAKNRQILIDSFVEYYGEEYRSIIEQRYNEITFVYYIHWPTVEEIDAYIQKEKDFPYKNQYKEILELARARRQTVVEKIFKFKDKPNGFFHENFVGMTGSPVEKSSAIINIINAKVQQVNPASRHYGSVKKLNRFITFQILAMDTGTIIHEINHAITRDRLLYYMDGNMPVNVMEKSGLGVSHVEDEPDVENTLDELLNDKSAEDITKIFISKGGDFSAICKCFPFVEMYKENMYIADEFYNRFKDLIKVARISNNKNELILRIGKEEYERLVSVAQEYYINELDEDRIKKNREAIEPTILELVDRMSKNVASSHTPTKEEVDAQIESLKEEGYTITRL